jgi:pimeloyl-ACP methyl ester carboxylesterase
MKDNPELEHWIADLSRPGRLTAGLNWYRANAIGLLKEEWPPVKVPTLGIWGTGDVFLSEKQMLGSQSYVDSSWRYERIPGVGHWIPLEAPRQLNTLLLDFLKAED